MRKPFQPAPPARPLTSLPGLGSPLGAAQPFNLPPAPAAAPAAPPQAPPLSAPALYERALTCAAMSMPTPAIETLRKLLSLAPNHADAWRKLADLLQRAGRDAEAAAAGQTAAAIGEAATTWPPAQGERSPTKRAKTERQLDEELHNIPESDVARILRNHLFRNPTDVVAMRLLARVEWRGQDGFTALALLERALALAPGYVGARADFARLLFERNLMVRVLAETAILLAGTPRDLELRSMRAEALLRTGRFSESIAMIEGLTRDQPRNPAYWYRYGISLRQLGRSEESARAFRTCLAIAPSSGAAYSGLADLRGNHLTDADMAAMRAQLADAALPPPDRARIAYALAHMLEKQGAYADAFAAYEAGASAFRNSIANTAQAHDPDDATDGVRRIRTVFSAANLAARERPPSSAVAEITPIFIVGMPRSGSTLVEQILASHSGVEGTRELPVMNEITSDIARRRSMVTSFAYPEIVPDLTAQELAALGARYIRDAAAHRQTALPYFVDKRPWNWLNAGLIALMLPQAKIIDVRRAPMAACFAMFKQLLPADAAFSYDFQALGRYYNEYVGLMRHWDTVMPGRIHYVSYERLVDDTDSEIRRLLEYCGLPFEETCLRFWETERAVATPSAEQVRRPIFRDAVEQWRHFEPWLGPLKDALAVPVNFG